jgi:hypothetical protein
MTEVVSEHVEAFAIADRHSHKAISGETTPFLSRYRQSTDTRAKLEQNKATLWGQHTYSTNRGGVGTGTAIQWCYQFLKHHYKWNSRALEAYRLDAKSKNELRHQGLWFRNPKSTKGGVA